ncbi:calcium-binding protein [Rhizobium sp. FKL33]|uniref:calcium-binding protein n=1 Tax=Rhizobium sp. FKL33 TaxID=2562307 RepID=UPI0010C105CA|nr:calcium-binding protein [Rhizobium sp. FKL33]
MVGVAHTYTIENATVTIAVDGDSWTFKPGGINANGGPAIRMLDGTFGNTIAIHSTIRTPFEFESAIALSGANWLMSISSLGVVTGYNGVYFDGGASGTTCRMINDGKIIAEGGSGVVLATKVGATIALDNSGLISGVVGLESFRGSNYVTNAEGGVITGSSYGVLINADSDPHQLSLENFGLIKSAGIAIQGSKDGDHVDNFSRIVGDVRLGGGNDTFINEATGSTVQGKIYGGTGDDSLTVHSAATKLIETAGQGVDRVISTVNYTLSANVETLFLEGLKGLTGTGNELNNTLTGDDGNDILRGMAGNDRLYGDVGNDVLTGGAGKDIFEFYTGEGRDRITDFQNGQDRMDIQKWTGLDTFADVKAHAAMASGDLVIKFGADVLTVDGLTLAQMDKTDFIF